MSSPATAAHAANRLRTPAGTAPARSDLFDELVEPLRRHRRAGQQRPLGRELEDRCEPLELAGPVGLGREVCELLGRVRIAPADRELGQHGLREQLGHRHAPLDLVPA